MICIKVPKLEG